MSNSHCPAESLLKSGFSDGYSVEKRVTGHMIYTLKAFVEKEWELKWGLRRGVEQKVAIMEIGWKLWKQGNYWYGVENKIIYLQITLLSFHVSIR